MRSVYIKIRSNPANSENVLRILACFGLSTGKARVMRAVNTGGKLFESAKLLPS